MSCANNLQGIICAVLGAETPSGEFEVMDVCWAGLPQQSSAVPNGKGKAADTESAEGTWVALVSGMELGGTEDADDLKADLLSEYLTGELAGDSVSPFYFVGFMLTTNAGTSTSIQNLPTDLSRQFDATTSPRRRKVKHDQETKTIRLRRLHLFFSTHPSAQHLSHFHLTQHGRHAHAWRTRSCRTYAPTTTYAFCSIT